MHIGHGSQVVATMAPFKKMSPTVRQASRIAFTSAWAVISVVSTTVLCEHATTRPSRSMAQPKGLWPAAIPCRHFSIASCINSSGDIRFGSPRVNVNLVLALLYAHNGRAARWFCQEPPPSIDEVITRSGLGTARQARQTYWWNWHRQAILFTPDGVKSDRGGCARCT